MGQALHDHARLAIFFFVYEGGAPRRPPGAQHVTCFCGQRAVGPVPSLDSPHRCLDHTIAFWEAVLVANHRRIGKLTGENVRQIRAHAAAGRPWKALRVDFHLSESGLGHIIHRRRWKQIA